MRRILEKRVLPILAVVCLLATMVAVTMSFAGASDNDSKTVILNIKSASDPTRSEPQANGYYLTLSDYNVYKGDKIQTNGEYLNYGINWQGTVSEMASDAACYIREPGQTGETLAFRSGLTQGKINGFISNEAKTLDKVGTYSFYARLKSGSTATLISFEVKERPAGGVSSGSTSSGSTSSGSTSSNNTSSGVADYGSQNPALDYSSRLINFYSKGGNIDEYKTSTASASNIVKFETNTMTIGGNVYASFLVGDKIKNTLWWKDYSFTFEENGVKQTGNIYNADLKIQEDNNYNRSMQVGYGHTSGAIDDPIVFEKPGEYYIMGTVQYKKIMPDGTVQSGTSNKYVEIARFRVYWPTQDIIDQLVENSQNGGSFYYEKQHVNLVVNDTTGTMCDYVGVDVTDIHVTDSLYINEVWSNYLFEYRLGGKTHQGYVDKVYLYGVEGQVSGYKQYIPKKMGENDKYVDVETGYGKYIDVNDPSKVKSKFFTFELTGTYAIYGDIVVPETGLAQSVYLGSFKVTATPTVSPPNSKFTNPQGVYDNINDHIYAYKPREIKYYASNTSADLGQYLKFDEAHNNTFYVTDKLVNGSGYWQNINFDYTDVYGQVHTGKIFNLKYVLVTGSGTKEMGTAQVGYGHSNGYGDNPFELTVPGIWMLIGQQIEDDTNGRINNVVMSTFTVFDLNSDDPRGTGDQFTQVSNALKWSGSFNKNDFKGDRANINANGYLYANDSKYVQLQTIAPLRLGTMFNITATYAKNIDVGGTADDKFAVIAGDLKLVVGVGSLGTYQATLYYQDVPLGTSYFTEDYKSAVGNYRVENNLGKITVYKDDQVISWIDAESGKTVTSLTLPSDYYFNVANVAIGVAGEGSYIPYLQIKPIDPTVVNVTKTISFEKFDTKNWQGNTGNIDKDGKLLANGRDLPILTTVVPYNFGNGFDVSASLMRTNGFTNYYGEKYTLGVGDIVLKVGSAKSGENGFVAQLYYKNVLLGTADRGTAGGYSISANWTIRFENGNISVIAKESKDATTNTIKFVSAATETEVTSFQVDEWDFERTYITVGAAGNYGTEGSCYAHNVTLSPRGVKGTVAGSTSGSSSTASTGDMSTPIYIILAILVAAGTVLVTIRKVRLA